MLAQKFFAQRIRNPALLCRTAYRTARWYSTETVGHVRIVKSPDWYSWQGPTELRDYVLQIPKVELGRIQIYDFGDKFLEEEVFTHSSWGMNRTLWFSKEDANRLDNSHLEFLGDSVLKGLTARLLSDTFPELTSGQMTILQAALVNNEFYSHMSRKLGLVQRLRVRGEHDKSATTRICAGLFEAYVGGMHKELGIKGYPLLCQWFESIMKPYAIAFKEKFEEVSAVKTEGGPSRVLPTLTTMNTNPSWTKWVNLYAMKNYLNFPEFKYERIAARKIKHPLVTRDMSQFWTCTVNIEGFTFESGMRRSKAIAKDVVCYQIYKFVMKELGLNPESKSYWAEKIASGECRTTGENKDDETSTADTTTADGTVTDTKTSDSPTTKTTTARAIPTSIYEVEVPKNNMIWDESKEAALGQLWPTAQACEPIKVKRKPKSQIQSEPTEIPRIWTPPGPPTKIVLRRAVDPNHYLQPRGVSPPPTVHLRPEMGFNPPYDEPIPPPPKSIGDISKIKPKIARYTTFESS
ncbi:hypothetical protein BZA77DRAFT_40281 [Pyronema omphalodes]|nr:hypothetical protein BZA77DRAFT_40281 [Pyronema omphalodes]